jgi:hypothetical protein
MSRRLLRRRLVASVALLVVMLAAPAPSSAIVPPTGGTSKCQSINTGWIGSGVWKWSDPQYVFDGRLRWDLCVVKTSTGTRAAYAQLSALDDLYDYDTFSGLVEIWLQKCISGGTYQNLQTAEWLVPNTETVRPAGRYYFKLVKTASSNVSSTAGYRVRVHSYNASVFGSTSQILALSPYGYQAIPETNNYWNSSCMTP